METILNKSPEQVAENSINWLSEKLDEANEFFNHIRQVRSKLVESIALKYLEQEKNIRCSNGKVSGTVTIQDGDYEVSIVRSKKITWDQEKLLQIYKSMLSNGGPAKAIQVKLNVSEETYKSIDTHIRSLLDEARSESVSSPKIALKHDSNI